MHKVNKACTRRPPSSLRRTLTNGSDVKYIFPLTNGGDVKYIIPGSHFSQVDGAYDRGDYAGAESRSSSAKCWGWAAVIFGLLEIVGIIVYILLLNGAVGSSDVEL